MLPLIIMLLCAASLFAQTVSVTFTGRDAQNQYLPLTRVEVSNLTKGWQETLYWPDTMLTMTDGTGIEDVKTQNFASLQLSQNNPNPFDGTTDVLLSVADAGALTVEIADIYGRLVETQNIASLPIGNHQFRIALSSTGTYVMTVRQNGETATIKMVNNGGGNGNKIEYAGMVGANNYSPLPQPKHAHRGATDNPFDPGDQMEYVGFAMQNGTEVESSHVVQAQESSQTVVLTFGDGAPCSGMLTVTDHEGNIYNTVQIGNQCWMRDNLRTTTSPSTGTYLVSTADTTGTFAFTGKQARWYNNDSATYAPMNYGLLYNWNAAVDTFNTAYGETSVNTSYGNAVSVSFSGNRRGICPAGWHLPSDAEWTQLTDYVSSQPEYTCVGNSSYIAKALASETGWNSSTRTCAVGNDQTTNNASGFGAVPAGLHWYDGFNYAGCLAHFWSSTEIGLYDAWYRGLAYYDPGVGWSDVYDKDDGFSVRCLRD